MDDDSLDQWIQDEWEEYEEGLNYENYNDRMLRRQRTFRPRLEPLTHYSDQELIDRFRFDRTVLQDLFELLNDQLQHPTKRNHAITPFTQMLIALRYYAVGDHFDTIGDQFGVHKSTVSRIVKRVTRALLVHMHKFVRMPDLEEMTKIQLEFFEKKSLPRVVGAIDGTHVAMMRPVGQLDGPFICRKGYPSINCFAYCDNRRMLRYIQAQFPGSCHDSSILKTTKFHAMFESGQFGNAVVLGDSGYGLRKWLLVPVKFPKTNLERRYNMLQKVARVVIEQAFGILKRRFLVLHSEMRLQPEMVCKVFGACSMLHNIAIERGLENFNILPSDPEDPPAHDPGDEAVLSQPQNTQERLRAAEAKRNRDIYITRNIRLLP